MYGVYANFGNNEKLLDSRVKYMPLPHCTRTRDTLSTDQHSSKLEECDYITYHTWFPSYLQNNKHIKYEK